MRKEITTHFSTADPAIYTLIQKISIDPSSPTVPLRIFIEQELSPLETLVVYLKEESKLSFHAIALLLLRDDRTIWTSYMRAKKKHA